MLKKFGKLYGPTTTILISDIDKDPSTDFARMNNWPNRGNNHGEDGANCGFGDGHVEFVRRGPEYMRTFVNSYQGLAQNAVFTQKHCPGLILSSTTVSGDRFGRSWNRYIYSKQPPDFPYVFLKDNMTFRKKTLLATVCPSAAQHGLPPPP